MHGIYKGRSGLRSISIDTRHGVQNVKIVSMELVKRAKPHTNGECFLVLNSGGSVKVSRSYRDVVARFVH